MYRHCAGTEFTKIKKTPCVYPMTRFTYKNMNVVIDGLKNRSPKFDRHSELTI